MLQYVEQQSVNNEHVLTLAAGAVRRCCLLARLRHAAHDAADDFEPTLAGGIADAPQAQHGAIYQSGHDVALFENAVARASATP